MSMLLEIYLFGLSYSLENIIIVGFAWLCVVRKYNFFVVDNAASAALLTVASGLYWNAIFFAFFYFLKIPLEGAWKVKFGFDIVIIFFAVWRGRETACHFATIIFKSYLTVLLCVGAIFGTWAFFVFPNALDCGQVKAVQTLIFRGATRELSMIGYSGVVLFATQFAGDFPAATVAGTLKPLLGMIAACIAYYAVVAIDLPRRNLNATILLLLIMLSTFGTFGLVERGKDSIFGVLFSFALILTMCRLDASRRGAEMALYFAAAAATGMISVPFMILAYVLWLLSALNKIDVFATFKPLYLGNLLILPFVTAGFLGLSPLVLWSAYVAVGGAWFVMRFLVNLPVLSHNLSTLCFGPLYFIVFLGLILTCIFLMPVYLDLGMVQDPDGTLRVIVRPPLDGKTTLLEYFLQLKIQLVTVIVGFASSLMLMLNKYGKSRPGLFVLAAMPFAMLACVLIRIQLQIPLLPNFHIWDLAKDTRMWYGGLFFSVSALTGINWLTWKFVPKRAHGIVLSAIAVLMLVWPIKQLPYERYLKVATENSIGGFQEQENAAVMEVLWENFKDIPVYLSLAGKGPRRRDLLELLMFGPSEVNWYTSSVNQQFDMCCQKIGLIVGKHEVQAVEDLAAEKGATVTRVATVDDGATEMLLIAMKEAP